MRFVDDRPLWRTVSFWVFFVVGTIWGAILGSWVLLHGPTLVVPLRTGYWMLRERVDDIADASRQTDAGASSFVWIFALIGGFACAWLGALWMRRSSPFAEDRRTRLVPPEGDD